MIPVAHKRVDLSLLHPKFKERLELFFGDGRVANKVVVVSGCRSYAEQKRLYNKYRAGRGNLAANPDWKRPGGFFYGSFHQEQPDGYSYAVDLRITGRVSRATVTDVARRYGFRPTVKGEWWHFQPRNEDGWFPSTSFPDDDQPEPAMDWAGVLAYIAEIGRQIGLWPLRRGTRGDSVRAVQQRLNALDFWCGTADGIFGRKTLKAVCRFQRVTGLPVNGLVNKQTWEMLWNPTPL